MSEKKVFFKIVIPNYNNIANIRHILDKILKNDFQDFMIVVVDDVSNDMSDDFCKMYARKYHNKITFIQNAAHLGLIETINVGINCSCVQSTYVKIVTNETVDALKLSYDDYQNNLLKNNISITSYVNFNDIKHTKRKIVCYTCITGNYDNLIKIKNKQSNIDYICFSDSLSSTNTGWKLRKIPDWLKQYNARLQQRIIKICPHLFLNEYDISIWIDGKIEITGNLNELVNSCQLDEDHLIYSIQHPRFTTLYQDAKEVLAQYKENNIPVALQLLSFKLEFFSDQHGFFDTAILIRQHNNERLIGVMNLWRKYVTTQSFRDQLSFTYCLQKHNIICNRLNITYPVNQYLCNVTPHTGNAVQHGNDIIIGIVNFNTTDLTNACIKSICKHVHKFNYHIIVFDNSTVDKKFIVDDTINNTIITIVDNTNSSIIDFEKIIHANKCVESSNNHASLRHAITIQWMLDNIATNDFVLMDSDVILKKDIDELVDRKYVTCGQLDSLNKMTYASKERIQPFIQYFNLRYIYTKHAKIKYFDINRMHGGANRITSRTYDTGASFYEDCIRLKYPIKTICTSNIINHMKGGSWINANAIKFINDNMQYLNAVSVGHNTISFCIVNFNTTDLTNACIKSICKVVKNKMYKIIIFDASDKTKFMLSADVDKNNVIIIDNTHNEIIDIDSYVDLYGKVSKNKIIKTHPSLRHAITIQWMLDNIATNDFVLMDSDVILKKDIDELVDRKYVTCGQVYVDTKTNGWKPRIRPFLQYFNLEKIRQFNLKFFDPYRIHEGLTESGNSYDTGASFYEDCCKLCNNMIKNISIDTYMIHLGAGSYLKSNDEIENFIQKNK